MLIIQESIPSLPPTVVGHNSQVSRISTLDTIAESENSTYHETDEAVTFPDVSEPIGDEQEGEDEVESMCEDVLETSSAHKEKQTLEQQIDNVSNDLTQNESRDKLILKDTVSKEKQTLEDQKENKSKDTKPTLEEQIEGVSKDLTEKLVDRSLEDIRDLERENLRTAEAEKEDNLRQEVSEIIDTAIEPESADPKSSVTQTEESVIIDKVDNPQKEVSQIVEDSPENNLQKFSEIKGTVIEPEVEDLIQQESVTQIAEDPQKYQTQEEENSQNDQEVKGKETLEPASSDTVEPKTSEEEQDIVNSPPLVDQNTADPR